jgi:hypothetical protein
MSAAKSDTSPKVRYFTFRDDYSKTNTFVIWWAGIANRLLHLDAVEIC